MREIIIVIGSGDSYGDYIVKASSGDVLKWAIYTTIFIFHYILNPFQPDFFPQLPIPWNYAC